MIFASTDELPNFDFRTVIGIGSGSELTVLLFRYL